MSIAAVSVEAVSIEAVSTEAVSIEAMDLSECCAALQRDMAQEGQIEGYTGHGNATVHVEILQPGESLQSHDLQPGQRTVCCALRGIETASRTVCCAQTVAFKTLADVTCAVQDHTGCIETEQI